MFRVLCVEIDALFEGFQQLFFEVFVVQKLGQLVPNLENVHSNGDFEVFLFEIVDEFLRVHFFLLFDDLNKVENVREGELVENFVH